MKHLLEAGPFAARDGEGRSLFADVLVRLPEARLSSLEGPSGCGKSTLLRQLVGLEPAHAAQRVLADEVYTPSELPAWRARVTLLAQDAPVLPGTVEDNLRFAFRHRAGAGRDYRQSLARQLLARIGLGGIPLDRDMRTLSGGERHRVALVRGLLWDPAVLVADEPLAGLDPEAAGACLDLLLEAAHRPGHAVMAVFHDPSVAGGSDLRLRLSPDGVVGV